jgi:mono/diheme cytochrome c family protein
MRIWNGRVFRALENPEGGCNEHGICNQFDNRDAELAAPAAMAQVAPAAPPAAEEASGLGEIIVTATKRNENLQSVPVSVTAITSDQLAKQGVFSTSDLNGSIPNLQVSSAYGETQPNFTVRALADNAGPRPNGRLLVFALRAKTPYKVDKIAAGPPVIAKGSWTPAQIADGGQIYGNTCAVCHGVTARGSGVVPDLRRSAVIADKAMWDKIVLGGALKARGMVSFSKWLTPENAEAVRGYVAERAQHLATSGN